MTEWPSEHGWLIFLLSGIILTIVSNALWEYALRSACAGLGKLAWKGILLAAVWLCTRDGGEVYQWPRSGRGVRAALVYQAAWQRSAPVIQPAVRRTTGS